MLLNLTELKKTSIEDTGGLFSGGVVQNRACERSYASGGYHCSSSFQNSEFKDTEYLFDVRNQDSTVRIIKSPYD